jgi:hypothetical protein
MGTQAQGKDMKNKKWVQHISGQGQKWEVFTEFEDQFWIVNAPTLSTRPYLPRSEYVECEGPEEWEDATADYRENDLILLPCIGDTVRIRKAQLWQDGTSSDTAPGQWAFIIERKVP